MMILRLVSALKKIKNGKKIFKNGQKMGDFEKIFLIT